ncbi:hypothetical protein [Segnochrobactrum spirostomi]|uniref:Uncharacterized protein n=1 Tax=Segnochrobactrum spirostomi TaxID=2608987 RepID=A0A6A7Y4F3_9HYPH|nr:hypothetical protein [Segnochrobactrum spirostomi]MQT13605.1 hypothetical protein [Segnochrobactrum spirostomi]
MITTKMTNLDDRALNTVTGGFMNFINPADFGPGPVILQPNKGLDGEPKFLGPGPALPPNDHGMDDLPYGVGPGIILPQ